MVKFLSDTFVYKFPDAGNVEDIKQANDELDQIDFLESQDGFFAGLGFTQELNKNWIASLNIRYLSASGDSTNSLQLGYLF